jgi:glutaredoxin 3
MGTGPNRRANCCGPTPSAALVHSQGAFEKSGDVEQCIMMKPKRVRLFIKPYCGWCHKAIRWLDERGVDYETVDVIADEIAFHEMIQLSGQDLAPVLEVDGKILADFGPDQLAEFWSKLEKQHARTGTR